MGCGRGAGYSADVVERVDVRAVIVDREVQMRAGRPAGRADIANGLSLRHILADRHGQGRLVGVEAGIAVAAPR